MEGFDLILFKIAEAFKFIFTYRESVVDENTLIFSTSAFWFLFAIVLVTVHFLRDKIFYRNLFLVIFSLFFYFKSGHLFTLILLLSTFTDFHIGNWIYKATSQQKKTWLLVLSIVINLGILGFFKYSQFIVESINHFFGTDFTYVDYFAQWHNDLFNGTRDIHTMLIPVGISFFTFQTMSYSIDLYRGRIKPVNNILDFAFFVTYFPQLVAGPIVRANEFVPQIYEKYKLTKQEWGYAICLILAGLIKKIFIADYLGSTLVKGVFEDPLKFTGVEGLMSLYGYAAQIYGDFSGYSDMAIGLALLMGFRLNMNFNSPYKALSITDFWRRWHISLSTWLKDYLYIPLGGNRSASIFAFIFIPLIGFILVSSDGFPVYEIILFFALIAAWVAHLVLSNKWEWTRFIILAFVVGFTILQWTEGSWYVATFFTIVTLFWSIMSILPETKKELSTYVNLEITMLLGGIWHGPSLKFIVWGAMHGAALGINKLWSGIFKTDKKSTTGFNIISWFLTFHFVLFCWIYFGAKDMYVANDLLYNITHNFLPTDSMTGEVRYDILGQIFFHHRYFLLIMAIGYFTHFYSKTRKVELYNKFGYLPDLVKAIIIAAVILLCYQIEGKGTFIYFQF